VLGEHALQLAVAVALLVPAVIGAGGPVRGLLAWRPLAWVGLVSYGLYLWHLDVLRELDDAPAAVVVLVGPVLAIALGAASWYAIERYALRLGRRGRADAHAAEPLPVTPGTRAT
jgi:peptidoglycan/LPS O-acetylase OafA/YrhL